MADRKIVDYLKKGLRLGYDRKSLAEQLRKSGYSSGVISEAFSVLSSAQATARPAANASAPAVAGGSKFPLPLILGVGAVLLVVTILVVSFSLKALIPTIGLERERDASPEPLALAEV